MEDVGSNPTVGKNRITRASNIEALADSCALSKPCGS
ncbi:hypothetical protein [Salmonella phage vB_SenS_SB13]|uniref:Uncharacterized protein n=1 Tax=Salmonella phage vB_SenS_SB13 TaxID=2591135 RepID=A0A5J6TBB5_9CAUD|nr:hypothetical protein HWC37_gp090 [Salmonella phage vB_SenS_SB13]QFG07624.1 hypothetical protein [Salmonella phage vB_SenS_SB13]